jgi:hypothetical protein
VKDFSALPPGGQNGGIGPIKPGSATLRLSRVRPTALDPGLCTPGRGNGRTTADWCLVNIERSAEEANACRENSCQTKAEVKIRFHVDDLLTVWLLSFSYEV